MEVDCAPYVIEMRGITKRFPGVLASDHVSFAIRPGEIHALLGENGAGKSTLMNILTGLLHPDSGEILIRGEKVQLRSPSNAIAMGIGMVHQHFRLVQTFTVAENVTLGMPTPRFALNMAPIEQEIGRFSAEYGIAVDPRAQIWQLSVGEQQRVEILKALYRGAEVLIMDEPTAVLTPQEVRELFETLRKMAASGKAIVFITHKLDEVMSISDRVTVLRGGRNAFTCNTSDTSPRELASKMVGRELAAQHDRPQVELGETVLELRGLTAEGDRGEKALAGITLCIKAGEILGIAGVAGNGQRELAEVITGLRKATCGHVLIEGEDMTNHSPRQVIDAGVSHIPEDRLGVGLAANLAITENAIMKRYRSDEMFSGPMIDEKQANAWTYELVKRFRVKTPNLKTAVRLLSGGNSQRLLLARETTCKPRLVVAVHPTRGLDVGATEAVHEILLAERTEGVATLLISEDLEELAALADRISVMYEGRIMGTVSRDAINVEEMGLMMAGVAPKADEKGDESR
ncbi:MAG: ABC transporter ATP-binding protein [Clostridia bacterium]|nr:ABC transporter ATP-binding protein [Clostridia bacterium]